MSGCSPLNDRAGHPQSVVVPSGLPGGHCTWKAENTQPRHSDETLQNLNLNLGLFIINPFSSNQFNSSHIHYAPKPGSLLLSENPGMTPVRRNSHTWGDVQPSPVLIQVTLSGETRRHKPDTAGSIQHGISGW